MYAALILFILSQTCSKLSVTFFVRTLTPIRLHRWIIALVLTATIAWSITAVFGFAFSCELPSPWNYAGGNCLNIEALYTYVEIFSAVLDAVLVILPVVIISNLQLASRRKFTIITFFASRALYVTWRSSLSLGPY